MSKKKYNNIIEWTPVYKIPEMPHTKMIHIDQISFNVEIKSQLRVKSINPNHVNSTERSITAVGMQKPVEVEIDRWNGNYENSTYIGRDGNHRFNAMRSIFKKTKPGKAAVIQCIIYNKNTNKNASLEWKAWQHNKNAHLASVCLPNSMEDSATLLSDMLFSGVLCAKAYNAIKANDWQSEYIEKALRDYMKADASFKSRSNADKDKLVDMVYTENGKVWHKRIKRYSRNQTEMVLKSKFKVDRSGELSACGSQIVRIANSDDAHMQRLMFLTNMINGDHKPGVKNVLVFHSKKLKVDQVRKKRKSLLEEIKKQNKWYQKETNTKLCMIDKLYFLGQLLDNNETEGQLIKASL